MPPQATWIAIYTNSQRYPSAIVSTPDLAQRIVEALGLAPESVRLVPISAGQVVTPDTVNWYAQHDWSIPITMNIPSPRRVWGERKPFPVVIVQR